jgi:hypothetical protein
VLSQLSTAPPRYLEVGHGSFPLQYSLLFLSNLEGIEKNGDSNKAVSVEVVAPCRLIGGYQRSE